MTAEVTTVIGQFSIKDGNWRNDAPNQVAVREPKAEATPGAGKGDLFVLAEVHGDVSDREGLERQLAEAVRDAYYLARGSITASLRRALLAVGEQLYHRNYQVSAEKRIVAGVVVLVMCQEDAFVAQTGSAAFFAFLGDYIRRYPARSVWLDEALPPGPILGGGLEVEHEDPGLGVSALVEPNLHYFRVEPGDKLILADSRLAGQLPLADVQNAISAQNIKTTLKNLGKIAQARDCSALVIGVEEKPQPGLGGLKVPEAARWGSLLSGQVQPSVAAEDRYVLEPELVQAPAASETPKAAAPAGRPGETGRDPGQPKTAGRPAGHHKNAAKSRVLASTAHEPSLKSETNWHSSRSRSHSPLVRVLQWFSASMLLLVTLLAAAFAHFLDRFAQHCHCYPYHRRPGGRGQLPAERPAARSRVRPVGPKRPEQVSAIPGGGCGRGPRPDAGGREPAGAGGRDQERPA